MKKILLFAAMALFTISAAAQNIGRVSVEELITLMPEYMEAQRTIAAVSHETTETFQAMVSEFQSKSNTFEQKKDSWTTSVRETKQSELADMQRRLQEFQQTAYQELQEKPPSCITTRPVPWISCPLPAKPSTSRMTAPRTP